MWVRRKLRPKLGTNRRHWLPSAGLLFYSRSPNSNDQAWGEDDPWVEDAEWGSWILPGSLFAQIGESIFFAADGTPLNVTGTTIAASSIVNVDYIFFSETKGLAVYDNTTAESVMSRVIKYFFNAGFPFFLPFEVL